MSRALRGRREVEAMAEFMVELYVARTDVVGAERAAERARLAAEELELEGARVRCVRSIFVPEDETCFLLYEAESIEAVRTAARRSALPVDRVATVAPAVRL